MKIEHQNDEVLASIKDVMCKRPDLFERFIHLIEKLKKFNHDDLILEINTELSKGDSDPTKLIKEIPKFQAYEYRIPPSHKHGVLRVQFIIEEDLWTICITRVWIKAQNPKDKRKSKKR
jgi:hypothetical protein